MKNLVLLLLVNFVFLIIHPETVLSTDFESLRQTAEMYRDYVMNKAREAREAKKKWMEQPNIENQNNYNRLRDEAHYMYKKLEDMIAQIEEAERASSFWVQTKQTASQSLEEIGGHISSLATKLFGASDDELFGPNWQTIDAQYAALREKSREIRERKEKLLQTPENEKEIEALLKEIEIIKKKYELLRIAVRTQQEALPFLTTFWGEEHLGRYINACVENFDIVSTIVNMVTLNPKIMYDVVKPAILLKFGDKYIYPKGNLTQEIADAIVIDILNVGPSKIKTVIDGLVSKFVLDPVQARFLEEYGKNTLSMQFDNLKGTLLKSVREVVEKEMETEILAYIKELPYEKLPAGSPAEFSKIVNEYFNRQAVRNKYIQLAHKSMEREMAKIGQINKAGYVSVKKEALGSKISSAITILDFVQEFVTIYTNYPLLEASLQAADFQAKKIREIYRERVRKKEIDPIEVTENQFVNRIWKEGWKFYTPQGENEIKKSEEKVQEVIKAKEPFKNIEKKTEEITSKISEISHDSSSEDTPNDMVTNFKESIKKLHSLFIQGKIEPNSFLNEVEYLLNSNLSLLDSLHEFNKKSINAYLTTEVFKECHEDFACKMQVIEKLKSTYKYITYLNLKKKIEDERAEITKSYEEFINNLKSESNKSLSNLKVLIQKIREFQQSINPCPEANKINDLINKRRELLRIYNENAIKFDNISFDLVKLSQIDLNSLRQPLLNLLANERSIISVVDSCEIPVENLLENTGVTASKLIDDLETFAEKEGMFVDLLYYMKENSLLLTNFIKDTRNEFSNMLRNINSLLNSLRVERMTAKLNIEEIQKFLEELNFFEKETKEMAKIRIRDGELFELHRKNINRKVITLIKGEQSGEFTRHENTLAYLIKRFSDKAGNYIPPDSELASWITHTNVNIVEIQNLANSIFNIDTLIPFLASFENLVKEIKEESRMIDFNRLSSSFKNLEKGIPKIEARGLNLKVGLFLDPTMHAYEGMENYKRYADILKNFKRGLSELPAAFNKLKEVQEQYKEALKQWYLSIISIAFEILPKVDKLLDENKVDEAKLEFDLMKDKYPPQPKTPAGVYIDYKVEELISPEIYAKHKELMEKVSGRLQAILKRSRDSAIIGREQDKQNIEIIRNFYSQFKSAYESRNDSLVMSFLGDSWSAGDGTTLADLHENLRRAFKTYNEIRFNLQNLQITLIGPQRYQVSYDVTITSRIYSLDIKHEEKSSVVEEVILENPNRPKISRTISGRFWYIE